MIMNDNIYTTRFNGPTACALGNFDGVHLGHRKLISKMLKSSQDAGLMSVIVTFEPHPSKVLNSGNPQPLITTFEKKRVILESLGVDNMLCIPFDKDFSRMDYKDFIYDILIARCNAKIVVAGFDYRFGYKGLGDALRLKEICGKEGIDVIIVDPLFHDGYKVSSTLIRDLIKTGDVKSAASFLGRPYSIEGNVVTGDALGRRLGFPTANIAFSEDIVLPSKGVYAVTALCRGRVCKGIANVGKRPTFDGKDIKLEVHLFDFSRDIYGEWVEVFFFDNLREEIRFSCTEDLTKQVNIDFTLAKKALSEI